MFAYIRKIVSYLPVLNFLLFSKDGCALLTWIQQDVQAFCCGLTSRVSFTHAEVETEDDLQMQLWVFFLKKQTKSNWAPWYHLESQQCYKNLSHLFRSVRIKTSINRWTHSCSFTDDGDLPHQMSVQHVNPGKHIRIFGTRYEQVRHQLWST